MELALNLVWLTVAITSLAFVGWQLSRRAGSKGLQTSKWHSLTALCCTLVILFFVISMTDDLHDQQIISEDSRSLKFVPMDGWQGSRANHSHHRDSNVPACVNSGVESIA